MKSHRNRSRTQRALASIGIGALLITAGGLALAKGPTAVRMDVSKGRVAPAAVEAAAGKAKATRVKPDKASKKADKAAYKGARKAGKGFRGKGAFDPEKRVERIKELLGLDDASAKRLGAVFGEHHASMKDLHENGGRIRTALAKEMEADVPNEKRVASLLDAMEMNRKAMDAERSVLADSMKKLLAPSQRAKLLLSHGAHGRGGRGGPGGPGGPGEKGPCM